MGGAAGDGDAGGGVKNMAATKKTIVTGKKAAEETKAAKGKKALMAAEPIATILKKAQEPVVTRHLTLLQLSPEGDLRAKVERLHGFLDTRFMKAEPELEPLVQMCDCQGWSHAAFATCPFCGDGDLDEQGKKLAKKAEKDGGELAAAAAITRIWPDGFERVVPAAPAKVVKTSPGEVKSAKKSRSQAAAQKAAEPVRAPVVEPPSAEELAVTFRQLIKRHETKGGKGLSIDALQAEAADMWENPGSETLAWQAMALLEERGEAERFSDGDDEILFKVASADGKLVGQLVAAFGRALDAEAPEAMSVSALVDAAEADAKVDVHLDPEIDGDLIKRAALQLVQSGRATRRGAMFVSTVEGRMELPEAEEPDADEQRAIHEPEDDGEAESDRSDTGLAVSIAEEAGAAQAIVLHHDEPAGTVEELDAAVVEIGRLHATAALNVYEMGVLIARIIAGKLYLQRRHTTTGHPVYETFAQFCAAELTISKGYAYQLAQLPEKFTRVQIEKAGSRKLTMLLQVMDKPTRDDLADKAAAGATSGQLALEIEKVQPKPASQPPGASVPDADLEEDDGDDEAPESEKPRQPATKPAQATPSKGPAATPTPREQRITVALMPGRQVVDLYARKPKPSSPLKRAKKIEQDPWASVELGNGAVMEFRVYIGEGGLLQLAIETTRSGS